MKILIAEDDLTTRRMLQGVLTRWGYTVTVAANGQEAWQQLNQPDCPRLAILDWMMPELDGIEVCRRVRQMNSTLPWYLILLTTKKETQDIVLGLDAGADDYLTKPFERAELQARVKVGQRVLNLQSTLAQRVQELQAALTEIKTLQGIVPICMYCKKIRNDQNAWQGLENYIAEHSEATFSHGICPECYRRQLEVELGIQVPAATDVP